MCKYSFLINLVGQAKRLNKYINFEYIARALDNNGFLTNRGTRYSLSGGRGIAKLVSSLFKRAKKIGNHSLADDIAHRIVGKNGKVSWA
ncbi:hypothetical protein JSO61_008745 [Riemerella anatipestifer]|uniref:hypothetical protein n=1 Tax=Riemerella anatipestifer TaxID=34085 RepID=UPI002A8D7DD2|nr:hypothetical protein [Riemerella anatipestifer]MDY3339136.1 hypothetical protein [Riemerella anatipestifer]